MPLTNNRVALLLRRIENSVLTTAASGANSNATGADSACFKITDAKLYVPVVSLSEENNARLVKQLNKGFKRPVYWKKYRAIGNKTVEIVRADEEGPIRELLDSSYEGVKRLFVLAYDNTASDN